MIISQIMSFREAVNVKQCLKSVPSGIKACHLYVGTGMVLEAD